MAKVAVIGAGSWGTALAKVLHTNGSQVTVWSIVEAEIAMLRERHEHVDKLPGVKLPEDMEFTTDLKAAVEDKEYLILAVPSVFTRSTAKSMAPFVKAGQIIVCVAKGIEENTLMTLSDIVEEEVPAAEVAVMCGPSHAEEVGVGLPTTVVAGAKKRKVAEGVQDIFMNEVFRVYTSPDVLGHGTGRFPEERHCTGSRYGGRTRLRGQHQSGVNHARNHRKCRVLPSRWGQRRRH